MLRIACKNMYQCRPIQNNNRMAVKFGQNTQETRETIILTNKDGKMIMDDDNPMQMTFYKKGSEARLVYADVEVARVEFKQDGQEGKLIAKIVVDPSLISSNIKIINAIIRKLEEYAKQVSEKRGYCLELVLQELTKAKGNFILPSVLRKYASECASTRIINAYN